MDRRVDPAALAGVRHVDRRRRQSVARQVVQREHRLVAGDGEAVLGQHAAGEGGQFRLRSLPTGWQVDTVQRVPESSGCGVGVQGPGRRPEAGGVAGRHEALAGQKFEEVVHDPTWVGRARFPSGTGAPVDNSDAGSFATRRMIRVLWTTSLSVAPGPR